MNILCLLDKTIAVSSANMSKLMKQVTKTGMSY